MPTDGTNTLWPSVNSWLQFVRAVDLGTLMDSLMPAQPGAAPITVEHAEHAALKLARFKALSASGIGARGDVGLFHENQYRAIPLPGIDPTYLKRAEWLAYWLAWAVTHCHQPVFVTH